MEKTVSIEGLEVELYLATLQSTHLSLSSSPGCASTSSCSDGHAFGFGKRGHTGHSKDGAGGGRDDEDALGGRDEEAGDGHQDARHEQVHLKKLRLQFSLSSFARGV